MTALLAAPATASPTWRDDAACRRAIAAGEADPNLWFPRRAAAEHEAVAVCGRCPVRVECLAWALERGEEYGVWGGRTEQQLRTIRRHAARRAREAAR